MTKIKKPLPFILKLFWTSVFLAVFFLLAVSVYQFNAYTQEIYFIRSTERKIDQFSQENKVLEINLAGINSLGNLGNYVQNFERVERIEYIRILEGTALAK